MNEPIAVVGTACRLPGASSPSKLWDLLREPRDVLSEFPPERFALSNFYHPASENHGSSVVNNKAYLLEEDVRLFDASFFRINPKEAAGLDPQHRLLLETVYEVFEAAGWPLEKVNGSATSVHVGSMTDDYYTMQARDTESSGTYAATGLSKCILSNRVSYAFDLKGPSMTIDTACSSGLVGLHLAIQGLRSGEATQAVVAGVNLLLDPQWFITLSSMHMISPDSRSRMWSKDANGYARGEGFGAVLLKPLSKAIQDGDHIQCVIRETGVNSDGGTNGITMPSTEMQAELIRQTYKNAGLDPVLDRPQYFECHGTGTQAGDPIEARAVHEAFFPPVKSISEKDEGHDLGPLYCGSIKTIIGHLEGCSGIAGLIKTILAMKNKEIPPNMHFNELNPALSSIYGDLLVPQTVIPWPEREGTPLRASLNSFGFGGTNAHAIIESYDASSVPSSGASTTLNTIKNPASSGTAPWKGYPGPFVLSARSKTSLIKSVGRLAAHVKRHRTIDLDALSYTLQSKRTTFSHRLAIPAVKDRFELMEILNKYVEAAEESADANIGVRAADSSQAAPILGIFTGQGAQAASMGRMLIEHCIPFRQSLQKCEDALNALPEAPEWSLISELLADEYETRLGEALLSQPLCTAIQIALVDLLHSMGIRFSQVVGHSSGEIGAAYAAGILKLEDAMAISYYRGYVAHMSAGASGQEGSMMAAAMSFDDATAVCNEEQFAGRVQVAASNAPASVTISGDLDAIQELEEILVERGIQARVLRLDTAYHSHHMARCADAYLGYLKNLKIQAQQPSNGCRWSSSVHTGVDIAANPAEHQLDGQYWVDNMTQAVLFSPALEFAVKSAPTPFTMNIEVGPHPALKGPVGQTLKAINENASPAPYMGCLERNKSAIETASTLFGAVWSHYGPSYVDFSFWREAFGLNAQRDALQGLPAYAWDHDKPHWLESRVSHNYRVTPQKFNHLLGRQRENTGYEITWRNILRLSEMPWVRGHIFQNQILLPGATYLSCATEATMQFVDKPVKMIEVTDVAISKALVMTENSDVELLFIIRSKVNPSSVPENSILEAEFVAYSCHDERTLDKTCQGGLTIHLGEAQKGDLPLSPISQAELPVLDVERFHTAISGIGFKYEGPLRAMDSVNRSWGHAKGTASWGPGELDDGLLIHPAVLDHAIQVGTLGFLSAAENSMGSCYVPVAMKRVIIDPNAKYNPPNSAVRTAFESVMGPLTKARCTVDINMQPLLDDGEPETCGVQFESLSLQRLEEPLPSDDRVLYAKNEWGIDCGYGIAPPQEVLQNKSAPASLVDVYERLALFYMKNLVNSVTPEELAASKDHYKHLFNYVNQTLEIVEEGNHPVLKKEWLQDDADTIKKLAEEHASDFEVEALVAVGENIPSVVQGKSEMMEHMPYDTLLSKLYSESKAMKLSNESVGTIMRQISHKFPRAKILEVGASTGATTLAALEAVGRDFFSYTCTDPVGFFGALEKDVPEFQAPKMEYKIFDVEKPPSEQDLEEGGYDVVIASYVLHATHNLSKTVQHARQLLRPGGYLVVVEPTGELLSSTGIMGGLEGWWKGVDEGRVMGPGVGPQEWSDILEDNGFSGIDYIMDDNEDVDRHRYSVFATQAVSDRMQLLRDPLSHTHVIPSSPLVIIGGKTPEVSDLARQAEGALRRWSEDIRTFPSIDEMKESDLPENASVLCLSDLDKPFFTDALTPERAKNLQDMFKKAKQLLWVTKDRMHKDPWSGLMVGVGRALAVEQPSLKMHSLDFDAGTPIDWKPVTEELLRMAISAQPNNDSKNTMWVEELEILVRDDLVMVPRVMEDEKTNELLSATRRTVKKETTPHDTIKLDFEKGTAVAPTIAAEAIPLAVPTQHLAVQVHHSVPLHTPGQSPVFLYSGMAQNELVLGICKDSSSTIVAREDTLVRTDGKGVDAQSLLTVASDLVTAQIVRDLPQDGTILLHGANSVLTEAFSREVARSRPEAKLMLISTKGSEVTSTIQQIEIHPRATTHVLRKIIPHDATALIELSGADLTNVLKCLPANAIVQRFDSSQILRMSSDAVKGQVAQAYNNNAAVTNLSSKFDAVSVSESADKLRIPTELLSTVWNWQRTGPVTATVNPIDPTQIFSPNKTYFLVGMAGELGQSLTRFMIRSGARHVAMASRNPPKDPHWIKDLRAAGADIRMVKMDVTDREQVREAAALLRKTMPEIGGVTNGALVFDAGFFVNFSAESIARQMKPKVTGSLNLDDEFSNDNLDFFLTFGSLATTCGGGGQSLYHAGNVFMASLVENRRRRGKPASILNFGLLVDAGYVVRQDRLDGTDVEGAIRSLFMSSVSETEFHHVVMQGILAGKPGTRTGEVIMGIEPYMDDGSNKTRPHWVDRANFAHMVHTPDEGTLGQDADDAAGEGGSPLHALRAELAETSDLDTISKIIQELLCYKLEVMIKVPKASIDTAGPLFDLGLDSLNGIQIVQWARKEFGIDVSLLRILGREAISALSTGLGEMYLEVQAAG